MEKIKTILEKVSKLLEDDNIRAIEIGERFNIFSIMRMEYDEVKTHSGFIGELLNPKGSHGQGAKFLKLFFEEIDILKDLQGFDFDNVSVKLEEYVEQNKTFESGFIDIIIKDKKHYNIIIENKINAPDQKAQLYKYYHKYHDEKQGKCILLYLTLNGKEPNSISYQVNDIEKLSLNDIHLISYSKTILNWIEKCLGVSNIPSMIKELLNHYMFLIKKITNTTANEKLKTEICDLIKSNFSASAEIAANFNQVKFKIVDDLFNKVKAKLDNDKNFNDWKIIENEYNKDSNILLAIKKPEWQNTSLAIWKKGDSFYNGVKLIDNKKSSENIKKIAKEKIGITNFNSNGKTSLLWKEYDEITYLSHDQINDIIENEEEYIIKVYLSIINMKENLSEYCDKKDLN